MCFQVSDDWRHHNQESKPMVKLGRLFMLLFGTAALATPLEAQSLADILARMQSNLYSERRSAFYELEALAAPPDTGPTYARQVALVRDFVFQHPEVGPRLITLLEVENDSRRPAEDPYHGDLIAVVAALDDPTALRALMGALRTGEMASRGLAALGDVAVPVLMRAATVTRTRSAALMALARMVAGGLANPPARGLSGANRQEIRRVLLDALQDPEPYYREAALEGLVGFNDDEVRAAVTRAATADPVLGVRHDATKVLRRMDSREPTAR
jgi:HEAT repeat protein